MGEQISINNNNPGSLKSIEISNIVEQTSIFDKKELDARLKA